MLGSWASREASSEAAKRQLDQLSSQLRERAAELTAAREEHSRLEGEMRLVLRAMEQQKSIATRNMSQLSKIYHEWSAAVNS